jgi:hypothetical protein
VNLKLHPARRDKLQTANVLKRLFRTLLILAIIYCLGGLALYLLQEKLLFHPEPLPIGHAYKFDQPHEEVNIPLSSDDNLSFVKFFADSSKPRRGIVLYFHGNMENIGRYAKFARNFTKHGYEVWMPDYPGFGKTTGTRTEERLYSDAQQVCKLARAHCAKDSIIIYGKSMGTGIAAQLASVRECKRLILETPYFSIVSLAAYYFPVYPAERLLKYKIPSHAYIQKTNAPLTIFHGTADGVIPYSNAKRFEQIIKPGRDEFVTIEGGTHHNLNDYPLMQRKLDSLLSL